MGKKFIQKSSLVIIMVLAVILTLMPKTAVLANDDNENNPTIEYRAHVQDIGWMDFVKSGLAGTEGQSKRLEALDIKNQLPEGAKLKVNAHVQDYGWQGWREADTNNQLTVGTTGESKRLEALAIIVTGLDGYEIKYRAHVEDIGWQDWVTAENIEDADTFNIFVGTTGQSKRLEAIEIEIVHVNHEYVYTDNGDGTHTGKCVCGDTLAPESCSYKYEPIEGAEKEHHQICSVCGSEKENSKESCSGEKCVQVDAEHHNVVCDKCENILEENKEHQYGKYENVESYVSSENFGTHKRTCDLCGYEDIKEHNYNSISGYIPHTQTEKGGAGTIMTCSVCGDVYKIIVREDAEFKHDFIYIYDQATDTHKKTCKVCGLTEIEDCDYEVMNDGDTGTHSIVCKICKGVKAVHKWSEKKLVNAREDGSVAATEHKIFEYTCADDENCNAKKTIEEHQYLQMPEKAATCTEAGHKWGFVCLACGDVKKGYETIPALGHIFNETSTSMDRTDGTLTRTRTCARCGQTFDVELLDKEEQQLNKEKEECKTTLEKLCEEDKEVCSDENQASRNNMEWANAKIDEIKNESEEAIKNAKSKEEAEEILKKAEAEIEDLMKLFEAKDTAIFDLHGYFVKLYKENPTKVAKLAMLFTKGDKNISEAEDETGVQQALEQAKKEMDEVVSDN